MHATPRMSDDTVIGADITFGTTYIGQVLGVVRDPISQRVRRVLTRHGAASRKVAVPVEWVVLERPHGSGSRQTHQSGRRGAIRCVRPAKERDPMLSGIDSHELRRVTARRCVEPSCRANGTPCASRARIARFQSAQVARPLRASWQPGDPGIGDRSLLGSLERSPTARAVCCRPRPPGVHRGGVLCFGRARGVGPHRGWAVPKSCSKSCCTPTAASLTLHHRGTAEPTADGPARLRPDAAAHRRLHLALQASCRSDGWRHVRPWQEQGQAL